MKPLLIGLAMGESPRWHDDRLWLSDWGAQEIIAAAVTGESEVNVRPTFGLPFCIDWLPDGRLLIVSGREGLLLRTSGERTLLRRESGFWCPHLVQLIPGFFSVFTPCKTAGGIAAGFPSTFTSPSSAVLREHPSDTVHRRGVQEAIERRYEFIELTAEPFCRALESLNQPRGCNSCLLNPGTQAQPGGIAADPPRIGL